MLGISHGTLQNLRVTKVLPYQKVGGIMFYKYDDSGANVILNAYNDKYYYQINYIC
jgi:hypothetical protein